MTPCINARYWLQKCHKSSYTAYKTILLPFLLFLLHTSPLKKSSISLCNQNIPPNNMGAAHSKAGDFLARRILGSDTVDRLDEQYITSARPRRPTPLSQDFEEFGPGGPHWGSRGRGRGGGGGGGGRAESRAGGMNGPGWVTFPPSPGRGSGMHPSQIGGGYGGFGPRPLRGGRGMMGPRLVTFPPRGGRGMMGPGSALHPSQIGGGHGGFGPGGLPGPRPPRGRGSPIFGPPGGWPGGPPLHPSHGSRGGGSAYTGGSERGTRATHRSSSHGGASGGGVMPPGAGMGRGGRRGRGGGGGHGLMGMGGGGQGSRGWDMYASDAR